MDNRLKFQFVNKWSENPHCGNYAHLLQVNTDPGQSPCHSYMAGETEAQVRREEQSAHGGEGGRRKAESLTF